MTVVEPKETKKKVGVEGFYKALKDIFWSSDDLTPSEIQSALAEKGICKSPQKTSSVLKHLHKEGFILEGEKKGKKHTYKVNYRVSKNLPWYNRRFARPMLDYVKPKQKDFDFLYHYLSNNNSVTITEFKTLLNKRDNKNTISVAFIFGILQIACAMKVINAYESINPEGVREGLYGWKYIPAAQLPSSANQEHVKKWIFKISDVNPTSWMNMYERFLHREEGTNAKKQRLDSLKRIEEHYRNYSFAFGGKK